MIIHRVPRSLVFGKRLQILCGQLESACDTRVNVVALLKVNVFKEITAYRSCRDGVAVHVDPGQLRNSTFHWHQSLAQVLINTEVYLWRRHSQDFLSCACARIPKSVARTVERIQRKEKGIPPH